MTIKDRLAAYQFDAAVIMLGTIVENAAQEMEKLGPEDKPRWENKYKMSQILDKDFRFPDERKESEASNVDMLKGAHGVMFDEVS